MAKQQSKLLILHMPNISSVKTVQISNIISQILELELTYQGELFFASTMGSLIIVKLVVSSLL
jgi:hypothetical protein